MPFPYEASVIHHNGHDYWRTWFFEECEKAGLFGITEKHLPLLKAPISKGGYQIGTEIFLEDAPYFKASGTHHLICGPYQVVEAKLPDGAKSIHQTNGKTIIYQEKNPQNGPWVNRSKVVRTIMQKKISFPQLASEFNFFPFRFGIEKSPKYQVQLIEHQETECWLYVNVRRRWRK
jgi:hypothetical protein